MGRPTGTETKGKVVMHKLSIVSVSTYNRFEKPANASAFGSSQTPTNYSLIVVCIISLLFALAGYGMAELSLLE